MKIYFTANAIGDYFKLDWHDKRKLVRELKFTRLYPEARRELSIDAFHFQIDMERQLILCYSANVTLENSFNFNTYKIINSFDDFNENDLDKLLLYQTI